MSKTNQKETLQTTYCIIGGGIAGVTCCEELYRLLIEEGQGQGQGQGQGEEREREREKEKEKEKEKESLERHHKRNQSKSICLISASDTLKGVDKLKKMTQYLIDVSVQEYTLNHFQEKLLHENQDDIIMASSSSSSPTILKEQSKQSQSQQQQQQDIQEEIPPNKKKNLVELIIVQGIVNNIDPIRNEIDYWNIPNEQMCKVKFKKCLIATGGKPRKYRVEGKDHPCIMVLRDRETVEELAQQLKQVSKVCLVGNGGIALELVYSLTHEMEHQHNKNRDSGSSGSSSNSDDKNKNPHKDRQLTWAVKHKHIGTTFLDQAAAAFLIPSLFPDKDPDVGPGRNQNIHALSVPDDTEVNQNSTIHPQKAKTTYAGAVGPRWVAQLSHVPALNKPLWMEHCENYEENDDSTTESRQEAEEEEEEEEKKKKEKKDTNNFKLSLQLNTEIADIKDLSQQKKNPIKDEKEKKQDHELHSLEIKLTNGKTIECDLLLCAMGVTPYTPFCSSELFKKTSKNGALYVNEYLQVHNYPHIFAAGDCCKLEKSEYMHEDDSAHAWFQMSLWSQAQQMGWIAASAMFYEPNEYEDVVHLCYNWELFAHITKFFNKKCIFLGRFNYQGLHDTDNIHYKTRMKMEVEQQKMIKLVVEINEHSGRERVVGAVLIGETGLEETCENLILNKTDISNFGENFLKFDVDLEDMFD